MNDSATRFRDFAATALETRGALVERIEPQGLEALLPERLQESLASGELLRLSFGTDSPAGAVRASLESDWLERFGSLLAERGRTLRLALSAPPGAPSDPQRLLSRSITLANAVYRSTGVTHAWTRYLILVFRYSAVSDEKREGVIKLGVNLRNWSSIDGFVDELLGYALDPDSLATLVPAPRDLPPDPPPARLDAHLRGALPTLIEQHMSLFLQGLQRRLDRDLGRVFDYYNGLRSESIKKLQKAKVDAARERLRLEAVTREYHAQIADLRQKYELRVTVELSQALDLAMPVEQLDLVINRRKGERRLSLAWNPLVRRLEPLPCEWGDASAPVRIVCDDALHLISPAGGAPCQECGKEYCRACHPRQCPRCRLCAR